MSLAIRAFISFTAGLFEQLIIHGQIFFSLRHIYFGDIYSVVRLLYFRQISFSKIKQKAKSDSASAIYSRV